MDKRTAALMAEFWQPFGEGFEIVLATADGDEVTARTVSTVRVGDEVFFATFDNSVKHAQIGRNPRVALCSGATQLRGSARVTGGMALPTNAPAVAALRTAFPDDVARIENLPGVVIVAITPATGSFARMETGEMFAIDFEKGTVEAVTMG